MNHHLHRSDHFGFLASGASPSLDRSNGCGSERLQVGCKVLLVLRHAVVKALQHFQRRDTGKVDLEGAGAFGSFPDEDGDEVSVQEVMVEVARRGKEGLEPCEVEDAGKVVDPSLNIGVEFRSLGT